MLKNQMHAFRIIIKNIYLNLSRLLPAFVWSSLDELGFRRLERRLGNCVVIEIA